MAEKRRFEPSRLEKICSAALAAMVLLTLAIRFAEPVRDGDLWWQMAYGRYLLEHGTLIPDHAAFSWGPHVKDLIYCAWVPQIGLYLLHSAGGLAPLFVLRYACLALFVLLLWREASKRELVGHPLVWLVCLLGLLMSNTAAFIKPEIFSYVFMCLLVWTAWQIKSDGRNSKRCCYLLPVIVLVWVNSHGGIILGAVFLAILLLGETLNILFGNEHTLAKGLRRHFVAALVLCAAAALLTPYGWKYPEWLLQNVLLGGINTADLASISDYVSIFDPQAQLLHFKELLITAAVILTALFWRQRCIRRLDWTLLLANVAFAWFYTRHLRMTHYWAMIFALSCLSLLAADSSRLTPRGRWTRPALAAALALFGLFLGGLVIYEACCMPFAQRWCGFGVSYQNPLQEAEYIGRNFSHLRLGNDYNSSGYLLWALSPETKVFYGPPLYSTEPWSNEYLRFLNGGGSAEFMSQYAFDIWCVSHTFERAAAFFRTSPDWKLAFYGPSAAVFVRRGIALPQGQAGVADQIEQIQNLNQAVRVVKFAIAINDLCTARKIVSAAERNFQCPNQRALTIALRHLVDGMAAYYRRDYASAADHLQACRQSRLLTNDTALVKSYLHLAARQYSEGRYREALQSSQAALAIEPDNLYAVFNVGVLQWYLEQAENRPQAKDSQFSTSALHPDAGYRGHLKKFLTLVDGRLTVPQQVVLTARQILAETFAGLPRVIVPPEPEYKDFAQSCPPE